MTPLGNLLGRLAQCTNNVACRAVEPRQQANERVKVGEECVVVSAITNVGQQGREIGGISQKLTLGQTIPSQPLILPRATWIRSTALVREQSNESQTARLQ